MLEVEHLSLACDATGTQFLWFWHCLTAGCWPRPRQRSVQVRQDLCVCWLPDDQVCIVRIFEYLVSIVDRTQVSCSNQKRCWPQPRALNDTCENLCQLRHFPVELCPVPVPLEEISYPVEDLIWQREVRHFRHHRSMLHSVECLCKVHGKHMDVVIGLQLQMDGVK